MSLAKYICQSNGLEMPCWGSIERNKCLAEQHVPKSAKKVSILTMLSGPKLSGPKKVSGHLFHANAYGCVGLKPSFYYPVGQLEPDMLETNFQHGHSR